MTYDIRFREKAIVFKENGHTFLELKEVFGITCKSYYAWKALLEETGSLEKPKPTERKRKIDNEALKRAVEEKPDSYLREIAEIFGCSFQAVANKLRKLGITLKKRRLHTPKNPKKNERSI
jgi:transposase